LVALAIAVAVSAVGAAAMPAGADPPPGNIQGPPPGPLPFKLINQSTRLCAAPAGGSAATNNVVVQYHCDLDPTRQWNTAVRGDGFQELYNASTGLCLSPAGGSTARGALIVQYYCDGDPARGWTTLRDVTYGLQIVNEHSGLCLALDSEGAGLNAALVQTTCDKGDPTGGWAFSQGVEIRNVNSSLEVASDPYQFPVAPNTAMIQNSSANFYRIAIDGTGWYTIEDADYGAAVPLCLSPAGGSTAKNAPIVEYYCDADPSRHWTITSSNGTYAFRNVNSNMCLSPAGGSTARGALIVQYYCDGDPSRRWTLVENTNVGIG
jgi:hypothetical protein